MKNLGLIPRLIVAIILGILIGKTGVEFLVRLFATFNGIFGSFLSFVIPLIIVGFVAPGIGDLGKGAGKLLAVTAGLAYVSTILSGTVAYTVNKLAFPFLLQAGNLNFAENPEEALLTPYLNIDMQPIMGVMTALLMAFIIGLGITFVKGTGIKNIMSEFQQIITKIVNNIIIPFLPLHIAGIFANMTYAGQVVKILHLFFTVFLIIIALHLVILLIQYSIAAGVSKSNPFKLMKQMFPAYLTALGTQSSAATIPVTFVQTKKNGVNDGVAEFVVPLCATIHLSGSTITITSCAMAIMYLTGVPIQADMIIPFVLMLGVTMVAAPGVPGGAVMAALGLLQTMLGFDETMVSLMVALYLAQDSFGTACNVTGDGAISIIVNRISGYSLNTSNV